MTDTEAIALRANSATPGPWQVVLSPYPHSKGEPEVDFVESPNGDVVRSSGSYCDDTDPPCSVTDAEFIAHARTDIPELLAKVRAVSEAARAYLDAEAVPAYSWVMEGQAALREGRPNREIERMERIARLRVALEEALAG